MGQKYESCKFLSSQGRLQISPIIKLNFPICICGINQILGLWIKVVLYNEDGIAPFEDTFQLTIDHLLRTSCIDIT